MSEENPGACYVPTQHSCEICGMSGLSDDLMREHTRTCHVEGNAQCPFCGFSGVVSAELLLHVNQAHLDYLTPENELLSFIDDQSPSIDDDSDSASDCRISYQSSNNRNEHLIGAVSKEILNSYSSKNKVRNKNTCAIEQFDGTAVLPKNFVENTKIINQNNQKTIQQRLQHQNIPSCSTASTNINLQNYQQSLEPSPQWENQQKLHKNRKNNDVNGSSCSILSSGSGSSNCGSKEMINGFDIPYGGNGQGSPLRSELGLKLRTHSPASRKVSVLQCPLCPYTSENLNSLEEHINRSHFDPLSPSVNGSSITNNQFGNTINILQCPICTRVFESAPDLELHVNIEHRDILSPGKPNSNNTILTGESESICPICNVPFDKMKSEEIEFHIEGHFTKSPQKLTLDANLEKEAQKLREQREFEMLRAQYGMDDQGNFREQSAAAMQRAVYAGEMSVADYYERQVGLRAAESHGIDDGTSCTKSVAPRVLSLSSSSPGINKSIVCSSVDHYASSYGDKGWGCGYRNLQMLLSSLLQNTTYNEALYSAWGNHGPSRTAMPSISRLQKMVEAAWTQGFDVQGAEQLGCKLYNTRKWIGATEIVTVLSWLRINCELVDFHRPTAQDGRHPELFNWVLKYFDEPRVHTPPLYLQHQGHSRTIIGIEQRATGLTLLVLDPSHGPRQVAALGSSQDSLRLIRRGPSAMRAPQYQIVAVRGLIETEEQYQASKVLRSLRIPPDR